MKCIIIIRCPKTSIDVPTGVVVDITTVAHLPKGTSRLRCPQCGESHEWSVKDAMLASTDADTAPAAQYSRARWCRRREEAEFRCPACRQVRRWSINDARLAAILISELSSTLRTPHTQQQSIPWSAAPTPQTLDSSASSDGHRERAPYSAIDAAQPSLPRRW